MTNQEAIERLKRGAPFSEIYDESYEEAISLAIKALEKGIDTMRVILQDKRVLDGEVAYDTD